MVYKYVVYALLDPVTLARRYVGVTKYGMRARLCYHCGKYTSLRIQAWVASLPERPKIEELDSRTCELKEARSLENEWIIRLRTEGCDLLNGPPTKEELRERGRKGGLSASRAGTAHRWDSSEAVEARKKRQRY